jgi:tetratricopeptide (TPR) repeat protein
MIVKDEQAVLARCLRSVLPFIDAWIIVDTGSTDTTIDIACNELAALPGGVVERSWSDFGANRTESLRLARATGCDYTLVIDADDILTLPVDYRLPFLEADAYTLDVIYDILRYRRTQLFRSAALWCYRGVVHEFPECEGVGPSGHLTGPIVIVGTGGAMGREPDRYRRDAATLEAALQEEKDLFMIQRYTFYLAQSWRDCGEQEKAETAYLRRAELGGWSGEVFFSFYQAGALGEVLGRDIETVLDRYHRAVAVAPNRAEPYLGMARALHAAGRDEEGYQEAARGLGLKMPTDELFVESWIYEYGLRDWYGVCAHWAGHHRESVEAALAVLKVVGPDATYRKRVADNALFALTKM